MLPGALWQRAPLGQASQHALGPPLPAPAAQSALKCVRMPADSATESQNAAAHPAAALAALLLLLLAAGTGHGESRHTPPEPPVQTTVRGPAAASGRGWPLARAPVPSQAKQHPQPVLP